MTGKLLDDEFIAELAEIVRHRRKNGLWGGEGRGSEAAFQDAPILVKNTETEEIPAWACMQVVDGAGLNEDSRCYTKVMKPTVAGIGYLFNGPTAIPASGYGTAQKGPIFNAKAASAVTTIGLGWSPTVGQWYLTEGASGPFYTYGNNTSVMDSNIIQVSRLKADPVAIWTWLPHSSATSGIYPTNASAGTFGTQIGNRYGDFRSLGIDFVSDTDTTTASCSFMRFNRNGTYLLSLYAPFYVATSTFSFDQKIMYGFFEWNIGARTSLTFNTDGYYASFMHGYSVVAASWTRVIHITAAPTTLKFDVYANGYGRASGDTTGGYLNLSVPLTYNSSSAYGRCTITKLDTMPSTVVYHL